MRSSELSEHITWLEDYKEHGEQSKHDRDALMGAFADLATEIRGWKNGR